MITFTKDSYYRYDFDGLSTDDKPVGTIKLTSGIEESIPNGSSFFELDTFKVFFYDAENAAWRTK